MTDNRIRVKPEVKTWNRVDELVEALTRFTTWTPKGMADVAGPTPRPAMVDPAVITLNNLPLRRRAVADWPEADQLKVEAMKRAVDRTGRWHFPPVLLALVNYPETVETGWPTPPDWTQPPNALWVRDGHHRSGTAKALGLAEIPAFIQWHDTEPAPPADVLAGIRWLTDDDAEAFKAKFIEGYQPPAELASDDGKL